MPERFNAVKSIVDSWAVEDPEAEAVLPYAALLGCIRIGAIPMPGPNLLTPKDIAYRLERGAGVAAITDPAGAVKVDEAAGELRARLCVGGEPEGWEDFDGALEAVGDRGVSSVCTSKDDPLMLYFTSGTVSYPKMVQHAHS